MFLTTFSRKSVILSEVDFVQITAVVMLNIDLYYESRSGLVKSSEQSERKTASGFYFAVSEKSADGQYRHTLRGGFFQKCLKSSPRRGLIIFFPNIFLFQ